MKHKLLIFVALLVALMLPATITAQIHKSAGSKASQSNKTIKVENKANKAVAPMKVLVVKKTNLKAEVPEGKALVTLTAGDVWQDGTGYQMLLDPTATAYGTIIPESGGLTAEGDASEETYAAFEYKIPENADGSCSTTNVILDSSETIEIPAGIYDYAITNPTPGDRIWIASANGSVGGRGDDFEFESGVAYEFVVSLGGSNDRVDLNVDDPNAPVPPTDIVVDPEDVTAEVSWTEVKDATEWNLRYRPYVDPSDAPLQWHLTIDNYEELIADWMTWDADGDGNNWGLAYADDGEYNVAFYSASWSEGSALTPDNWLVSPEVKLGGKLSFNAWAANAAYSDEVFRVYITQNLEWESEDDFIAVSEDITTTGEVTRYEFDLSEYEGTGFFAIRHYNCTDQYELLVSDIDLDWPGSKPIPEWTEIDGITQNPYLLEGLEKETTYQLQLQSVKDKKVSDWSDIKYFTTYAEPLPEIDCYIEREVSESESTLEQMEKNAVGKFEYTSDFAAGEKFRFGTPMLEMGGEWMWFGAPDLGEPAYIITDDSFDTPILLSTEAVPFQITDAGNYTLTVSEKDLTVTVKCNGKSGIEAINASSIVGTKYVNMVGQVSDTPFEGVNVKIVTLSDGSKKAIKIVK